MANPSCPPGFPYSASQGLCLGTFGIAFPPTNAAVSPMGAVIQSSRYLREQVTRGLGSLNLEELQALGARIRQVQGLLQSTAVDMASAQRDTSAISAEAAELAQVAAQVGTAITTRAQQAGSRLVGGVGGATAWLPWAALGGVLVMWYLTRKGK
jgi:hypothetical protein